GPLALRESPDPLHARNIGADPVKPRRTLAAEWDASAAPAPPGDRTTRLQSILMSQSYRHSMQPDAATESRLGRARRQAARAKLGIIAASVVIFPAGDAG